jgi:hypothetical protein
MIHALHILRAIFRACGANHLLPCCMQGGTCSALMCSSDSCMTCRLLVTACVAKRCCTFGDFLLHAGWYLERADVFKRQLHDLSAACFCGWC